MDRDRDERALKMRDERATNTSECERIAGSRDREQEGELRWGGGVGMRREEDKKSKSRNRRGGQFS